MMNCNLEKYDNTYIQYITILQYIYHGKNTQKQNSPFGLFISKLEMHLIYKP